MWRRARYFGPQTCASSLPRRQTSEASRLGFAGIARGAQVAWVEHWVIPVPDDLDGAPCEALGDPLRLVFLGTLVVPASAPAAFFDDVFLAPLFRSVAPQGLNVRVFYGRGEHACAADVRREIGTSVSVEVEEGCPYRGAWARAARGGRGQGGCHARVNPRRRRVLGVALGRSESLQASAMPSQSFQAGSKALSRGGL